MEIVAVVIFFIFLTAMLWQGAVMASRLFSAAFRKRSAEEVVPTVNEARFRTVVRAESRVIPAEDC